jgi:hypothetical protein
MTDVTAPAPTLPPLSGGSAFSPQGGEKCAGGAVIRDGGGKPQSRCPSPEPATLQDIVDVVQASVRKAKEGDAWSAEIVRRYWRDRRATLVLDIGETRTAAEIAEAQGKVLALTFAGEITPREGRDVSIMLENRRKALHTLDQQRDLEELMAFAKQQQADAKTKGRR